MGLTYLEFTISPEGYPRDLIVTGSTSKNFTDVSVDAMRRSIYQPRANGKSMLGERMVFVYSLTDIHLLTGKMYSDLKQLKTAAVKGNAVAQYQYATRLNAYRYFKDYLKRIDLQYKTANKWFTDAANNGLPNAQFELGRNMIEGRGCKVDTSNGYKWISAAAVNGYSPAQRMLGVYALNQTDENARARALAAIAWLRNAAMSGDFSARVLLAWELSTATEKDLRDGRETLSLLQTDHNNYFDDLRILETKAAAYAELGNFKQAVKIQRQAAREANKYHWNIPLLKDRLGLYEHNEPYRGSYF